MELLLEAVLEVFVLFGDTIGAAVAEKLADSNSLSRLPRWLRIILSIVGGTLFVAALFALGMLWWEIDHIKGTANSEIPKTNIKKFLNIQFRKSEQNAVSQRNSRDGLLIS